MAQARDHLRAAGLDVWTDENLRPGTPAWEHEIAQAIQTARALVVLLSPDAYQSEWVGREITYAETFDKPIYPVLLRGDERDAVPFRLINHQRIDATRDPEKARAQLSSTLLDYFGLDADATQDEERRPPTVIPQDGMAARLGDVLLPEHLQNQRQLLTWVLVVPAVIIAVVVMSFIAFSPSGDDSDAERIIAPPSASEVTLRLSDDHTANLYPEPDAAAPNALLTSADDVRVIARTETDSGTWWQVARDDAQFWLLVEDIAGQYTLNGSLDDVPREQTPSGALGNTEGDDSLNTSFGWVVLIGGVLIAMIVVARSMRHKMRD